MNNKIEKVETAKPIKEKSIKPIYIGAIIILAVILGVTFYLDNREKKEMLAFYTSQLDAAQLKFEEIGEELDKKIFEIDSLGGQVFDLITVKDSLRLEMEQMLEISTVNAALIQRLQSRAAVYEKILEIKDKEIEDLRVTNLALFAENTDLRNEHSQLTESVSALSSSKQELEDRVAFASRLNIENLAVYAIAKNGKERRMWTLPKGETPVKMKQIEQLKVEFNISENNVAPQGTKDIMIRVIDPNGQLVFDIAKGSGTFMLDGKEEFYTLAQTIIFDNSWQELTFLFTKGSEYKTGQYTIEALTDGYQMGSSTFTVR